MKPFRYLAFSLIMVLSFGTVGCSVHGAYTLVLQESATGVIGEIYGSRTVGQTFHVSRNNLARIELPIQTYNRPNHHPLNVHLIEIRQVPPIPSNWVREVVNVPVQPEAIGASGYTVVRFPALVDSAGKDYYLYLDSADSSAGDAMTTAYNIGNPYRDGSLILDGRLAEGDLAFRAYSDESFTAADVWKDFSSRASGDLSFFVFYGLLLVTVAGLPLIAWRAPHRFHTPSEDREV